IFVSRLCLLKLLAVFFQLARNSLQAQRVLTCGVAVSRAKVCGSLCAQITLLCLKLLDLAHEAFAQTGVRRETLIILSYLLAEILRFHFQQSFRILPFQT